MLPTGCRVLDFKMWVVYIRGNMWWAASERVSLVFSVWDPRFLGSHDNVDATWSKIPKIPRKIEIYGPSFFKILYPENPDLLGSWHAHVFWIASEKAEHHYFLPSLPVWESSWIFPLWVQIAHYVFPAEVKCLHHCTMGQKRGKGGLYSVVGTELMKYSIRGKATRWAWMPGLSLAFHLTYGDVKRGLIMADTSCPSFPCFSSISYIFTSMFNLIWCFLDRAYALGRLLSLSPITKTTDSATGVGVPLPQFFHPRPGGLKNATQRHSPLNPRTPLSHLRPGGGSGGGGGGQNDHAS